MVCACRLTSAKGHFEMSNSLPSPGEYAVRLESGAFWKQQEKDFFHLYVEVKKKLGNTYLPVF